MFAVATRSLKSSPAKIFCRNLQSNVLSGPPRVRISPGEKLAHGLAIAMGILAIPSWVLVNIKHYRGQAE